jgi:F0F1-type ATP synthase assembly protein I
VLAIDLPRARRLAFGVVLGQAGVTVVAALVAWGVAGVGAAQSALLGGGVANAQRIVVAFYAGEALKLTVVATLFVVVLRTMRVVPLAMLSSFAATYLVFWIALIGALPSASGMRRGD